MHLDSTLCLGKINVYRKTIIAQSSVVSSTKREESDERPNRQREGGTSWRAVDGAGLGP